MDTINSNLLSLTARQHRGRTNTKLSSTLERLSSGLEGNSAADDAAGLAIGNRMQANLNANDVVTKSIHDGTREISEDMLCPGLSPNAGWSLIDSGIDWYACERSHISHQHLLAQSQVKMLGIFATTLFF